MSRKVRQLKCVKDIGETLVVDGIYVEYGLTPHHFYPPGRTNLVDQVGMDVRLFEEKGILYDYFEELDPIEWKDTREYPQVVERATERLSFLEESKKNIEIEISNIKSLIE